MLWDDRLYVLTAEGIVYALDPADGTDRWSHSPAGNEAWGLTQIPGREAIAVTTSSGGNDDTAHVTVLSTSDGTPRWHTDYQGSPRGPVSDGVNLYAGQFHGTGGETTLSAFALDGGGKRWSWSRPGYLFGLSPASAGCFAYRVEDTTDDGPEAHKNGMTVLHRVSQDGGFQWTFARSCRGFSLAATDELAFLASREGDSTLYAIQAVE